LKISRYNCPSTLKRIVFDINSGYHYECCFLIQPYEWITFIKIHWQRQWAVFFQLSFISDWRTLKRRFKAQRWATTAPILYRSTLRALPTKPRVTSSTAQRLSGQKISETIRSKIIRDYYQVKNIQTLSGQKNSWSREFFVFNWIKCLKFQCISNSRGEVVHSYFFYCQPCAIYLQKYCRTMNVQKPDGEDTVP